jgi:hypothetical protein
MKRSFRVVCSAALILTFAGGAWAQNKACALATPDELQTVLGAKVSGLKGSDVGEASICSGQAPTAQVMLRLAKGSGQGGGKEAAGLEVAKKMGAQVDVKTFGPVTCSTMIPPASLAQYGFNTTCSIVKRTSVAAIEITAKSQKDMIAIDRLRPLAEKMAARF